MLKSQKLLLSLVLVAAVLFAVLSAFPLAYAEELPPDMVAEEPLEPTDGSETENLVDRFIANLKDKYGDDYEYYLNAILEQWGSVEAYLLSLYRLARGICLDMGAVPCGRARHHRVYRREESTQYYLK